MVNCHFEQGAVWDPKASLHCIDLHVVVIINVKTHVKLYFRNWPLLADPLKPLSQQATSSPYYFFNRPRQHVHYFASRDTHVLWTWGSLPFKVSQRAATHVLFLDTGKDITTSLKELVESFLSRVARRQRYVYVYIYIYMYREREMYMYACYISRYVYYAYVYIYIYIYIYRERDIYIYIYIYTYVQHVYSDLTRHRLGKPFRDCFADLARTLQLACAA